MNISDPVSDLLARLRNALSARQARVPDPRLCRQHRRDGLLDELLVLALP